MARPKDLWDLTCERHYLDHLGTGKWSNQQASRTKLLESYANTILLRSVPWRFKALAYANELLEKENERR